MGLEEKQPSLRDEPEEERVLMILDDASRKVQWTGSRGWDAVRLGHVQRCTELCGDGPGDKK